MAAHLDIGTFNGRMSSHPVRFPNGLSTNNQSVADLMNSRYMQSGGAQNDVGDRAQFGSAPLSAQQHSSVILDGDKQQDHFYASSMDNAGFAADNVNNTDYAITNKSKDKTPMCLIAELVRYNKLNHQYKLINESGPAHQKRFTVCLTLCDGEEYVADGPSIKKAQQAAARKALEETQLARPARNPFRRQRPPLSGKEFGLQSVILPTVALNELAAKLNKVPEYVNLSPFLPPFFRPPPPPPPMSPQQFFSSFNQPPRLYRPRVIIPPLLHGVSLKIDQFEFFGRGVTRQLAKHDAAAKAVRVLRQIVDKNEENFSAKSQQQQQQQNSSTKESSNANSIMVNEERRLMAIDDECFADSADEVKTAGENDENKGEIVKSPISLVHEMALHRKMNVSFEIVSETGPAHNREFLIRLTVQNGGQVLVTQGEGASKKRAKHSASEKMVLELKKFEPPPAPQPPSFNHILSPNHHNNHSHCHYQFANNVRHQRRVKLPKEKKRKTIIKDVKMDPNYGQQINPVSRLVQIQQAKKEPEPVFTLVKEMGQARYKEYVMQVTVGDKMFQGTGPNKKLAKRCAAEIMLDAMGYSKPLPKPGKPVLKHQTSLVDEFCGGNFEESRTSVSSTCENVNEINTPYQPIAGSNGKSRRVTFNLHDIGTKSFSSESSICFDSHLQLQTGAKYGRQIAPGLLFLAGSSEATPPSDDVFSNVEEFSDTTKSGQNIQDEPSTNNNHIQDNGAPQLGDAKQQLAYLSSLFKFQMQFTDFPKTSRDGVGGEYLSLISVGVHPTTQVFHGSGPTIETAQNVAANAALNFLTEKGFGSFVTKSSSKNNDPKISSSACSTNNNNNATDFSTSSNADIIAGLTSSLSAGKPNTGFVSNSEE